MIKWFNDRPWIYVVGAFVVLMSFWAVLLTISIKNQPEKVPLQTRHHDD